MFKKKSLAALSSALALCAAGQGSAVFAAEENLVLEEVIVTATRRAESLQDVPTSIVAVTAADLDRKGITDFRNLSDTVSGLILDRPTHALGSAVYIRGVGTEGTSGAQKSVGVLYDGIYVLRPGIVFTEMFDLATVEVLRGPQGTLFGKNTTAGVIRINTQDADPTEFSGKVQGVAGNLDARELRGVVNVPIIEDVLALRVSGFTAERDGYTKNVLTGDDTRNVDRDGYRAKLGWDINEDMVLKLSAEHTEDKSDLDEWNLSQSTTGKIGEYAQQPGASSDEIDRYIANFRWMVADHSLTAYYAREEGDSVLLIDYDESPTEVFTVRNLTELKTDNYELQWTSDFDGPFNYLLGYYRQEQDSVSPTSLIFPTSRVDRPPVPVVSESEALFGNFSYEFNERWKVQVGARYSEDSVDATTTSVGNEQVFEGTKKFDEWSWSLKLNYQLNDGTMMYAAYDKGYKQGGINRFVLTLDELFYDSEIAYNYEIGVKSELLDNTLRLNAALFHTTYEDYQYSWSVPGEANVVIYNAAEVKSTGIEADFLWWVNELLTLDGSVTLLDTEYEEFTNSPCNWPAQPGCVDGFLDLSGETLNRAPELSFNLGGELRSDFALIRGTEWFARLDAVYKGDQNLDIALEEYAEEDAYVLANARLGLASEAGWTVTLWGRNIFDENYRSSARVRGNPALGTVDEYGVPGIEATYGVTLDYAF